MKVIYLIICLSGLLNKYCCDNWVLNSPHIKVDSRQIFKVSTMLVNQTPAEESKSQGIMWWFLAGFNLLQAFGPRSASFIGCVCLSGLIMWALSIWQQASSKFANERDPERVPTRQTSQGFIILPQK